MVNSALHAREGGLAGAAPGRPEIQHNGFAFEFAQFDRLPIQVEECKVGGFLVDHFFACEVIKVKNGLSQEVDCARQEEPKQQLSNSGTLLLIL